MIAGPRNLRLVVSLVLFGLSEFGIAEEAVGKPIAHGLKEVAGWKVRVDERLLGGEHAAVGASGLRLLKARLEDIVTVVPEDKVTRLRQVPIWLDLGHGGLASMQYHPSSEWLEKNGYARELAGGVHIPVVALFLDAHHQAVQPWSVLHELAHAYHDQVLGFEEARVAACWENYVKSGRGERALHVDGRRVRHYALTNAKEFFAEMTEAYFGVNDFEPFVHGQLKVEQPEIYGLLREIWGDSPLVRGRRLKKD